MSRIEETFKSCRSQGKKVLIPYITAGFPDTASCLQIIKDFDKAGADLIEIGVPFSDPIADGPVIQASSQIALEKGINLLRIFDICRELKKSISSPYLLMGYYNPILHYGLSRFAQACFSSGVSGIIVPDLPIEENADLKKELDKFGIDLIGFVTPYTKNKRMKKIFSKTSGFLYFVSRAGVTGVQGLLPAGIKRNLSEIKRLTNIPVAVGFGISTTEQIENLRSYADGIIVGSVLVKEIAAGNTKKALSLLRSFRDTLDMK